MTLLILRITLDSTYEWEAGRRLKAMSAEGTALTFKYDYNGLRTQKIVQQDWYPVTTNYTLHGKLITHMTVDYTDWNEVAQQDLSQCSEGNA